MAYQAGNMLLEEAQKLYQGKVNDVIVCRDLAADVKTYYTVLVLKDRDVTKRVLKLYEDGGEGSRDTYVCGFSWREYYLMAYAYQKERPVEKFLLADVKKQEECEALCMNIVTECMSSQIPYPILYLQLMQGQIHISKDGRAYFGYHLDLSQLSLKKGEKDCASLCARILFDMLEQTSARKTVSYQLLFRKNLRDGYRSFPDLYKDLKTASLAMEKHGLFQRFQAAYLGNRDKIFRLLLAVCLLASSAALLMFISQIIFADLPFMRLFVNSFEQIGTESLAQ